MFLATHGVLRRSSSFVPPVFADTYSFEYDGVSDYLEGNTTYSELDGVSKASFSMWLKPETGGTTLRTVFQIGDGSASGINGVCQLFLFEGNRIDFSIDSGPFFGRADISGVTYGSWNHLLITVDLDTSPEFKCFVNGVDATTSDNMGSKSVFTNATQGLMIGEWHTGKYAPFLGGIDEFAIWSGVALTSTDVASIYNSGVPNNLNDSSIVTTAPTTWLRADSSTWDGSRWTVDDENSSYQLESNNMTSASRTSDVPT